MSAVAAARLDLALDHIAKSFEDPNLTIAAVARRQNISARYLQRLIETTGTSFTTRVNELRLQRALALLTKPGGQDRRILDLALEAGFSDISHFNRLFRARFGDTPSGVRRTLKEPIPSTLDGLREMAAMGRDCGKTRGMKRPMRCVSRQDNCDAGSID